MNTYARKQKLSLARVRLHYVPTKINKREITKATLVALGRPRIVRWAADRSDRVRAKFRKVFRVAARNGGGRKVDV
jgi:hypothetical protein